MTVTALPRLPLIRYRLDGFDPSGRPRPRFPGSAWRGALGHQLRRIACLTGASTCEGCPLRYTCAYNLLFDTPIPPEAEKLRRYPEAPNPYVLREASSEDGQVSLHLTLIGKAAGQAALMLHALIRAAETGEGVAGRRLSMHNLARWDAARATWVTLPFTGERLEPSPAVEEPIPPCPEGPVRFTTLTPLRLRQQGRDVTPATFTFGDFFAHLLRRVSLLSYFHTDTPLETDFRALTEAARALPLRATDLHPVRLKRHSNRQGQDMELRALSGSFEMEGRLLAPFWPYLWLGQFVHVGRTTTMGLGAYQITSASLPNRPGGL